MGGKTRPAYPAEYKQQIVERYASGRRIADLAKEFGCSEQSIATWVTRAGTLGALPDKGTGVRRTHQARARDPSRCGKNLETPRCHTAHPRKLHQPG